MKFTKFFEAFPTPKFLDIPFAGISITDSAVHCIAFAKDGDALSILKYATEPLAQGIVTSGQISNVDEVVHILQQMKKDLGLRYVKFSLPEEKAYLFTAKIPVVTPDEVLSAVESQIEDNVPVSPSELVFDYRLTSHKENGHLDVVVSALPITVVDMYTEVAEKAGLSLLSLEIESQAIARSLLPKDINGTVLIVHFGREKVGLYVVTERVVHFTSTVPLYAMSPGTAPIERKAELENNFSFMSREIKKLYTYWHTLKENVGKPERKIEQIIVCGEHLGEEIVPYLTGNNQTPTILGNVWTNVFDIHKTVPPITFDDSLGYVTAVGLALPVNILI